MITKKNIDKMLELPDDRLWAMLKLVLTGAGVNMSGRDFDEKTIRKLRAILEEITDGDIERIMYLMEVYKRGG